MSTMIVDRIDAPWTAPPEPAAPLDFSDVHARFPAVADFHRSLGHTSLRDVPGPEGGARILAKCEWENPAGSVKDRVAYALLCDLLRREPDAGSLRVLEYSGGNLAAALSFLGAAIGVPMRLVLSAASPPSLLDALASRGAEVVLVDRDLGFLGVMERGLELARADRGWRLLYQHRNPVNVAFHETTTGAEILEQLGGVEPRAWVASIGTGGTLVGVHRHLRRRHPRLRTVGVTPAELPYASEAPPNGLPKAAGSGGLGNGIRQPFVRAYEASITDQRSVSLPDAMAGMRRARDATGLRIGTSAAANWLVACEVAAELPPEAVVVTLFPDAGSPEEWEKAEAL
jgi:cysteine synthase